MIKGLARITIVKDGVEVRNIREALSTARWWVIRVRDANNHFGLWCVYGGRPGTVLACLQNHGPVSAVVAYPFDDAHTSMVFRHRIEKKYMPAAVRA